MSYMKKVVLDENKNTVNLERESNNFQNIMPGKHQGKVSQSKLSSSGENLVSGKQSATKSTQSLTPINADNTFQILTKWNNLDILCIKAINAYNKYDINQAYEYSKKVMEEDPLKLEILPVYCCCLLEKQDHAELFKVAGMLEQNYPHHAISSYAIGLYLFLSNKFDIARKFFKKANMIDKNYFYSWIAMGHAFAVHDEADNVRNIPSS